MKWLYAYFLALVLSGNVMADILSVNGKVTVINNWEGHSGNLIKLSDMSVTSGLCSRNDFYILDKGHAFHADNYALLLSARVSEKFVSVQFSKMAINKCLEGFPRIVHMQL